MELVPGTVIAGRYRLERLLASGGMGAVWVARHLTLGNDVALKFMHGDPTELTAARSRFEREARTASSIRHPNVVTVQDYGIEGQTPYMAMELLHGENLDDYLVRKKRVSLDELEPIISQVSRGLRKAHETGVVHRDLKPSNIFISRDDDGREVVKILDFGIAKEIDTTLGQHTKTTELMGSPHYMSPEQLRSTKKSDFRSDLWSLAVIIYKAIAGVNPFPGDTLAEVMVQVFSGKWAPPSTLVAGLPPTIDAFFQRAFARKPDDRFQSIHDMHNAFVAVVAGKPLPAPTTPAPAANPATTPLPLTASSPSWPGINLPPGVAIPPPPRPSAPSTIPLPRLSSPDLEAPKVPTTFGPPPTAPAPAPAPAPTPAPTPAPAPPASNPDTPEAFEPTVAAPKTSFGVTNATANWLDNPPPQTKLPEDPRTEPVVHPPPEPPRYVAPPVAPTITAPAPTADSKRPKTLVIAIAGVFVLIVVGLVIALSGSSTSTDKPVASAENSAHSAPKTSSEPSGEVQPAASTSAAPLTPEEIASAVPDETPVEVVPNETPTPTPSATQTTKSNFKLIPKGQARLLIKANGGVCKITINSTYYGVTPIDVMVDAGKARILCRMSTGTVRSKDVRAPEGRTTKIEFDVKQ